VNPSGQSIKIQVKALYDSSRFPLSEKNEHKIEKDFYYAFVNLKGFKSLPDFWIIHSAKVGPLIREAHQKWRDDPERNHSKTLSLRTLPIELTKADRKYYRSTWSDEVEKYKENIEQLKSLKIL